MDRINDIIESENNANLFTKVPLLNYQGEDYKEHEYYFFGIFLMHLEQSFRWCKDPAASLL